MLLLVPNTYVDLTKFIPGLCIPSAPPAICTALQRVNDTRWFDTEGCVVQHLLQSLLTGVIPDKVNLST